MRSQLSLYQHPIRGSLKALQPCQKTLNISHPDEARLPRLPDSMRPTNHRHATKQRCKTHLRQAPHQWLSRQGD
ncbi:hypothetical protein TNCV_329081 [Trichonephila clavipes]|nr:hypothetical protein TNCV_329081 [Trichonephila clavipes]